MMVNRIGRDKMQGPSSAHPMRRFAKASPLVLFDKSVVPREQKIYTVSVYIIFMKKSSTDFIKIYKYSLFFEKFYRNFYRFYENTSVFYDWKKDAKFSTT